MTGHTKEYVRAAVEGFSGRKNELVSGRFTGYAADGILLMETLPESKL